MRAGIRYWLLCLIYIAGFSQVAYSQNTLNNLGLPSGSPSAAAFSLRKLSTSYSGNAIQVRRSSDNTLQNIGFTANGDLDTASLKTFVGSGSGFVATWYDQSGNARNSTQSTAAIQPRIINAGVVSRENSKPTLVFSGAQFFNTTVNGVQASTGGNTTTVGAVFKNTTANSCLLSNANTDGANRYMIHAPWGDGVTYFDIGNTVSGGRVFGTSTWTSLALGTFQRSNTTANIWKNGVSVATSSAMASTVTNTSNILIGTIDGTSFLMTGALSEIILFPSALSAANRLAMEASQSGYYAIPDAVAPVISCLSNMNVTTAAGACSALVTYPSPTASDAWGGCTTAPAISGFTALGVYNGTAYYVSNSTATFTAANTAAIAAGGQLASVTSAAENTFIRNAVTATSVGNNSYWIGLNDLQTEGTWLWPGCEAFSYSNWQAGEPNGLTSENNVQVYNTGTWNDLNGANTLNYVIEVSCITLVRTAGLASGSSFPIGISTVTYSATDAAGNSSNGSFTITVSQNAASVNKTLTAPATSICSGSSTVVSIALSDVGVNYQLRNAANVNIGSPVAGTGGSIDLPTGNLSAATTFNVLATTVATSCSYSLTNTITITVGVDNIAPVISCLNNITITAAQGACNASVSFATPTVTDNCTSCTSTPAIAGFTSLGLYNGTAYYVSNSTATYTAASAAAISAGGQLASITTAAENTFIRNAVNASSLGNITYWAGGNDITTEGTWVLPTCEALTYTNWNASAFEPNGGTSENCLQINNNGTWNDLGLSSTLNYVLEVPCNGITPVRTGGLASGSNFPAGTTTVTYTATDAAGNASTRSFTVTVNLNAASINKTVTASATSLCSGGSAIITVALSDVGVNYQLRDASNTNIGSPVAGTGGTINLPTGNLNTTTIFNILATNVAGSCSFSLTNTATITVAVDNVAPIISCLSNITVTAAQGACTAPVNFATPTVTDNCSSCTTTPAVAGFTSLGLYNGTAYYVSNSTATYTAAATAATAAGGQLVSILSAAENTFIRNAVNASSVGTATYWAAANDNATEGTWIWPTCEAFIYTNWNTAASEPNGGTSENCLQINSNGTWNDLNTSNALNYVIEVPCNGITPVRTAGLASASNFPVGATTVTYTATDAAGNTGTRSFTVTVNLNAASINKTVTAQASSVCVGGNTNIQVALSDAGVNYQLRNASNINIGSPVAGTGGTISLATGAIAAATTFNILATNTAGSCSFALTNTATVNVTAPVVSAPAAVCVGSNITLSPTTGGTWASSNTSLATVTNGGVVTGVSAGSVTFTFTQTSNGCSSTTSAIAVNARPTLSGATSVCIGSTTTLSPASGGTWASSSNVIATISNAGVVTPVAAGSATFTFTQTSTGCTNTTSTFTVPAAPSVSAAATVCKGGSITLSPTANGTWVSNNTSLATVTNAGVVTGIATGSVTFTYTQTSNGCSNTTSSVAVTAPAVSAPSGVCVGSIITLSPTTGGTWVSSNSALATVTNAGVVTGIAPGVVTFTFTQTSNGCSNTTGNVTVSSLPTVTISPNYCVGGGLVRLTCNTQTTYLWSTGATTKSIDVNVAGNYTVTATNAAGCSATDVQVVGTELVTNGDFSAGNTGFMSAYTYVGTPSSTAMYPEGTYAIGKDANAYHNLFWCNRDHSSGSGNFMIVNGSVNTLNIWQQTVTVQPNTVYYFSAWGISVNGSSPFADLKFRVNGVNVGTTQSLPGGGNSNAGPFNWLNFYGTWNSGSATSAIINIVNLETAAGGNDFALDDISFATIAPINLVLAPASNTPVCTGSTLNLMANVSGGRAPFSYTWSGPSSFTSSAANPSLAGVTTANAGVYSLSVTDGYGCSNSSSATVVVNTAPANRSVASSLTSICSGSSTNIQVLLSETGVNYQLRNNATNALIGSSVAGTGATINLPTGALTATTTFNVLATSGTGSCTTQMSSTAAVTVNATGQWIGGTSGDWNVAGNWCGGIPTSSTSVSIPTGTTVTIQSANALANSVTIASTASLIMTGAYNLSITAGGTFANSGTFTATNSSGTVAFLGGGTISGTTTFKNVDTYGPLNFGTSSTIAGTFSLQTGGSVTGNAPVYSCPASILLYKPGTIFNRGLEWTTASNGAGYPANVLVQNNTTINFPAVGNGFICYDLQIEAGSSLNQDYGGGSASLNVGRNVTINGTLSLGGASGGDLTLGGNWTRNAGGVFNANDRKVTFDGTGNLSGNGLAMSTISAPASSAKNNEGGFGGEKFAHLWMNKATVNDSLVLLSNITITREIGFSRGTFSLRNSDVTLVSNSTRTADVAPITTLANVALRYGGQGKFAVQRFVQNPTSVRSWRLLCAPLQSATAPSINEAWQEGVVNPNKNSPNANNNMYNPWPGFGTHITGVGGAYSLANGFDQGTNSGSILQTNAGILSWTTPSSTLSTKVTDKQGWMLFVRGDRGFTIGNQYAPAQNTTLEPKGRINIGNVSVPIVAGKQVVANPYASAISLLNVDVAGVLGKLSSYYVWDPKFFTSYTQPGKWVSFTGVGNLFVKTTSQSAYSTGGVIESGQAFLVESLLPGNITFHESDKLPLTSSLTGVSNRPFDQPGFRMFRTDLYVKSDTTYELTDGVLNIFKEDYNNMPDENDTKKLISFNTKESLSLIRDTLKMAIEKRSDIQAADTIFYSTSKLNELPYRFRFEVTDFSPATEAFFEDNYTGIKMPINNSGVTEIDVQINADNAAKAENRFRVVFKNFTVLPVKLLDLTASKESEGNNINLQWKVDNETDMAGYQIERSDDGVNFSKVGYHVTYNSGSTLAIYNWKDTKTKTGVNSYRLKMMDKDGHFTYSKIVAVRITASEGDVKVYPNPVTDGVIKINFSGMPKGQYTVKFINAAGQMVLENRLQLIDGNAVKEIMLGNSFTSGTYQLEINNANGYRKTVSVIVQK